MYLINTAIRVHSTQENIGNLIWQLIVYDITECFSEIEWNKCQVHWRFPFLPNTQCPYSFAPSMFSATYIVCYYSLMVSMHSSYSVVPLPVPSHRQQITTIWISQTHQSWSSRSTSKGNKLKLTALLYVYLCM